MPAPQPLAALFFIVAALTGCDTVTALHPVGVPFRDSGLTLLDEEGLEPGTYLRGLWVGPERSGLVCWVEYFNDTDRLRLTFLRGEAGGIELSDTMDALLTAHEEALYLNLINPETADRDGVDPDQTADTPPAQEHLFLRLIPTDFDSATVLVPNPQHFAQAVEAGALTGTVDRSSGPVQVSLTGPKAQLDAHVQPDRVGTQFNFEKPLHFRRVFSPEE